MCLPYAECKTAINKVLINAALQILLYKCEGWQTQKLDLKGLIILKT